MGKSSLPGTFSSLVKGEDITFVTFEENHILDKLSNWTVDKIILSTDYLQKSLGQLTQDIVRLVFLTIYWLFRLLRFTLIISWRFSRWTLINTFKFSTWTIEKTFRITIWTLEKTFKVFLVFLELVLTSETSHTSESEESDPTILRRSKSGKTWYSKEENSWITEHDVLDGTGRRQGKIRNYK